MNVSCPHHVLLNKVEQLSVAMAGERVLSTDYNLPRKKVRIDSPSVLPTILLQSVFLYICFPLLLIRDLVHGTGLYVSSSSLTAPECSLKYRGSTVAQ